MNFSPFGTQFTTTALPAGHQFATAKFTTHQLAGAAGSGGGGQVVGLLSSDEAGVTYLRPVDANGFTVNLQQAGGNNSQHNQIITLPIAVQGSKPGDIQQQTLQIQVVNPGGGGGDKYTAVPISLQHFQGGGQATVLTVAYSNPQQGGGTGGDAIQLQLHPADSDNGSDHQQHQHNNNNNNDSGRSNVGSTHIVQADMNGDEMVTASLGATTVLVIKGPVEQVLPDVKPIIECAGGGVSSGSGGGGQQTYPVAVVTQLPPELILRSEDLEHGGDKGKEDGTGKKNRDDIGAGGDEGGGEGGFSSGSGGTVMAASSWQTIAATGTGVADYLSRLPQSSFPLSLHHFLKFNADTIKREAAIESSPLGGDGDGDMQSGQQHGDGSENQGEDQPQMGVGGKVKKKKKYKKKPPKPRRPRPGQVHIATALDGTTLFCCPECNMAYPDKELLEQHLVAHKIERRFICDICGAGLKRKEHLERHKLGHNPERPYICSVCCKGFKRKEHLNLHFVIHSGEKTEVCGECGKGFYRKDHLRKHARSHIAKRVKEEVAAEVSADVGVTVSEVASGQVGGMMDEEVVVEGGELEPGEIICTASNNGIENTVVLPTAAETGAMALLHHHHQEQHHQH